MPGPVSDSYQGARDHQPYVPGYCYPNGPKVCGCGHHEGYHAGLGGACVAGGCGCKSLPAEAFTTDEELSHRKGGE